MNSPAEQTARLLRVLLSLKQKGVDVRQTTIAAVTGMTQPSVSQVFNGVRNFPMVKLPVLCQEYGINPNYILFGEPPVFGKAKQKSMSVEQLHDIVRRCMNDINRIKIELKIIKKSLRKKRD